MELKPPVELEPPRPPLAEPEGTGVDAEPVGKVTETEPVGKAVEAVLIGVAERDVSPSWRRSWRPRNQDISTP